jgi:polyvinyl alcohol dehydrogenase (cytochrome)
MRQLHLQFAVLLLAQGCSANAPTSDPVGSTTSLAVTSTNSDDDGTWKMFNHDVAGSRENRSETILSASNVGGLHVKWQYAAAGPVNAVPVVVDNTVYVGDFGGFMYAFTSSGSLLWKTQVNAPISASATVAGSMLVFGDLGGFLYGLNRSDGSIAWTIRPNAHPTAAIFSSGTKVGQNVLFGIASTEEAAAANPNYPCCSFRGSVLLLNSKSGNVLWQTYTISSTDSAAGAAGAGVWSTPTLDQSNNSVYVTTGNDYTNPTSMSEAFIAFDANTGAIKWVNQRTPNDTWNYRYPFSPGHIDADFGDSAQVYQLASGQKVVGAGQKSGFYHVVDAATGQLVNQIQVEPAGLLGGLFNDTAVSNGVVYANGINWPGNNAANGTPPTAGDLIAIAGDGSQELWRFTTPGSPDISAVAVANGVVYFTSAFNGNLYALNASNGAQLASVPLVQGGCWGGPSVDNGQVYVGVGINFAGVSIPGAIYALGL